MFWRYSLWPLSKRLPSLLSSTTCLHLWTLIPSILNVSSPPCLLPPDFPWNIFFTILSSGIFFKRSAHLGLAVSISTGIPGSPYLELNFSSYSPNSILLNFHISLLQSSSPIFTLVLLFFLSMSTLLLCKWLLDVGMLLYILNFYGATHWFRFEHI